MFAINNKYLTFLLSSINRILELNTKFFLYKLGHKIRFYLLKITQENVFNNPTYYRHEC
jgi:hypothetical protein